MKKIYGYAAVAFLALTLLAAGPSMAADLDQGPAEKAGESIDEFGRDARDTGSDALDAVTPRENEGIDLDYHGDEEK
ncbi:MAG: hypothetical protein AAGU11_10855 [Syntrophobacteraceae bacterium]